MSHSNNPGTMSAAKAAVRPAVFPFGPEQLRMHFQEILADSGDPGGGDLGGGEPAAGRARLPAFVGIQPGGEAALDHFRLTIIGCGSVGGSAALHAARLGLGELRLVDSGFLKAESTLTHPVDPGATGNKALYFGRRSKAIRPGMRVFAASGSVETLGVLDFAETDLVVLATDNLAAEIEVGQRSMQFRKPLLQASVHGDTLVAQVRFWRNADGMGPCPRCAYGSEEEAHLNQQTRFRCGGAAGEPDTAPTMSTSFLCSLAADLLMAQVLLALRLGPPLADGILEHCGFNHKTIWSPLVRRAACPCVHVAWEEARVSRPLETCSLQELAHAALGGDCRTEDTSFQVGDDLVYVEGVECCGAVRPVRRFCLTGDVAEVCAHCGTAVRPQLYHAHRDVPAAVLRTQIDRPLGQIGAGQVAWVLVHHGDRAVLCRKEAAL